MSAWELSNEERHTLEFGGYADCISLAERIRASSPETYAAIREELAERHAVTADGLDRAVDELARFRAEFRRDVDIRPLDRPPLPPVEAYADEPQARKVAAQNGAQSVRANGHASGGPQSEPRTMFVDGVECYQRDPDPSAEVRPRIAAPIWFNDARPNLARRDAIADLLGCGTLSSAYGGSGSGKTYLALSMALAIARGEDWCGKPVTHGVVFYAAGEGHQSVLQRLEAYRLHHFGGKRPALPFATIPQSIDLLDQSTAEVEAVAAIAKQAESDWELPTVLIVIDTLARSLGGANENASEVMGTAVQSADRLRELTGAHVMLIHHTGKAENGARGHSSLRAALDTEIEVTGTEGMRIAKVTKQRDLPTGATFAFNLKPIVLGTHPDTGADVTSCVVEHLDAPPQSARRPPAAKNQAALLAGLKEFVRERPGAIITPAELAQISKVQGLKHRARLQEAREGLLKHGWIIDTVGGIRLAEETL